MILILVLCFSVFLNLALAILCYVGHKRFKEIESEIEWLDHDFIKNAKPMVKVAQGGKLSFVFGEPIP